MAYREAAQPPGQESRLEYGPFPLPWSDLFSAAWFALIVLGTVPLFIVSWREVLLTIALLVMDALLLFVTGLWARSFLTAPRRLLLKVTGPPGRQELLVEEGRLLGARELRVPLQGIEEVKTEHAQEMQVSLRFSGGREVVVIGRGADHERIVAELRPLVLPEEDPEPDEEEPEPDE